MLKEISKAVEETAKEYNVDVKELIEKALAYYEEVCK